ncbi:MAG: hypothetical protein HY437_01120 [Candidatus Magasanikbacteria bacterium]|nr:hypothetical protein [Candidatus Magasanikbacteria bacterium]
MSYFLAGIMVMSAFLFNYSVAQAQEVGGEDAAAAVDGEAAVVSGEISAEATVAAIAPEALPVTADVIPTDVVLDMQVTMQDLGATDATILPGSPLHVFKRFWWGTQEVFTFNPVAKANLILNHASQEMYEMKKLIETEGVTDASVVSTLVNATERYEARLADVADLAADIQAEQGTAAPAVEQLMTEFIEQQIDHEKVLDFVEAEVVAAATEAGAAEASDLVALQDARDGAMASTGEMLVGVIEDPAAIAEVIDAVLIEKQGSDFIELKNLEFLDRLEGAASGVLEESLTEAIGAAEDSSLDRLEASIAALSEDVRAKEFVNYMEALPADEANLLAVVDTAKAVLPSDVVEHVEELKDAVVTRIAEEFEVFGEESEVREAFFGDLKESGDFEDLRILDEIAGRIVLDDESIKEEIERYREEGVQSFKERFTDEESGDQAERFQSLSLAMAEKPDPTTFKLLLDLEGEVRADPSKAAFVDQMQELGKKTRFAFETKAQALGADFMERIATNDPRDLEVMRAFAGKFQATSGFEAQKFQQELGKEVLGTSFVGAPEGFDAFSSFANTQKTAITKSIQNVDDPEVFRTMQARFTNASADVVKEMQSFGNFSNVFNNKATVIQQKALEEESAKLRSEFQRSQQTELFSQLQGAGDESEKQAILKQFQERAGVQLEQQLSARQDEFKQFTNANPFCNEACQQASHTKFEKNFAAEKASVGTFTAEDVAGQLKKFEQFQKSGLIDEGRIRPTFGGTENVLPGEQGGFPGQGSTEGTFPGQGATTGQFPGQGSTEGVFPGRGATEGQFPGVQKPAAEEKARMKTEPGSYQKPSYQKPSSELTPEKSSTGEFKFDSTKPGTMLDYKSDATTGVKPEDMMKDYKPTGGFDDLFKQPTSGDYKPTTGDTSKYPAMGTQPTSGYQMTPEQKQMADQYKQPSTGMTQPTSGTQMPSTGTQPTSGMQQPTSGTQMPGTDTQPTSGYQMPTSGTQMPSAGTTQPTVTEPVPTAIQPMPTYTAPTVTEPMPTYTAPSGGYTMPSGGGMMPPPGASIWRRVAVLFYNFITLPARAFGL